MSYFFRNILFRNQSINSIITKNALPVFSFSLISLGYFYKEKYTNSKYALMKESNHQSNNVDPLWRSKAKMRLGDKNDVMIISGTGNVDLAEEVAERLGMELSKVDIKRYSDGEINIQVLEEPRGKNVFLIQPTCNPANENLFELFLLVSALKKASCKSVTVVLPYYGYSTLDKKNNQKIPIVAADVARMLEIIGVNHVAAIELHTSQIQGFFSICADNIESNIIMIDYLLNSNLIRDYNKLSIVSPDANGVYRAKKFADILVSKTSADIGLSLVIKEKLGYDAEKMVLVGNVEGNECIILDDIVDSATTLVLAADELYRNGAKSVYAFATHGVLSGTAIDNLKKSNIKKIVFTNTIPINKDKIAGSDKFIVLSSASLIAETIRRIYNNESLSEMFL